MALAHEKMLRLRARAASALLARGGGTKRYASRKLDPVMFPEHKRFWDLEPTDLQSNPDTGLFLPGAEFRSPKPGDLDLPEMDGHMAPLTTTPSEPMHLGIKPLTYGRVICISTRAKVTRDDKVRSFGALILGGNGNGVAGYGYGRGKTGQLALLDAEKKLHLNLFTLPRYENYTIFHPVVGYFRRTVAVIRPASDGRGLHAGKLAHGIMSCFGIRDAYAKLYGQKNVYSQTKAIFKALSHVRSAEEFAMARGRKLWELNRQWIDRPARFMEFTTPEKQRMQNEATAHEDRVREVRRILVDLGRDEQEDMLSSPIGLKTFVDMITAERMMSEDAMPWIKAVQEARGGVESAHGSLDADFSSPAASAATGASRDLDEEDFAQDEIVYADKDLVDTDQRK